MRRPRPLDPIRSLKAKWSIVILAAVAVTAATSQVGLFLGWPVWVRLVVAGALALSAVQVLSHGMILPLRQMAVGASEMRKGVYSRRVEVTARDEIGQLAAAFNQMAADLAEVDRLQKEFLANASHELRTPVAALRGQIENLADGVVEATPALLQVMQAQAEHLSKLVAQLLDLSWLEAGAGAGLTERCEVEGLLQQVVEEAQLLDPAAAVALEAVGPLWVMGDDARLHQLFTNLLGNALRFTPDGAKVVVRARTDGEELVVEIRDRGPGIAPEHRSRVFERFWQADGATPTGGGGAGLGLALCKRIVDRHEGSIELTGNDPAGTCVTVVLPVSGYGSEEREEVVTTETGGAQPDERPVPPAIGGPVAAMASSGAPADGLDGSEDRASVASGGPPGGGDGTDGQPSGGAPPPAPGPVGAAVGAGSATGGGGGFGAGSSLASDLAAATATGPHVAPTGPGSGAGHPAGPGLSAPHPWSALPPPPPIGPAGGFGPPVSPPRVTYRPSQPLPELSGPLAGAIVATAAFAGLAVQLPGPSLALALAAAGTAVIVVVARAVTSRAHWLGVALLTASGAALAVRTSPWITAVEVLAVFGLAWVLAIDGLAPARPRSWLVASGESFINLFDWVPWWSRAVAGAVSRRSPDRNVAAAMRGGAIALAVVLCLGALLASGDVVFGHVVSELFGGSWSTHLIIIAVMVVPASVLALTAARRVEPATQTGRTFRVEALTTLWATTFMLAVWCVIQIVVAAGGAESVLEAEGATVADYAREGFFQLVGVAALSLTVVHLAHRVGGGDRLPVSAIGVGLAVLISISYSRLVYYMDAFGLTMLRLSVATFLAWLAVMTVASVIRAWGLGADRNWLPTAAVLTAGVLAVLYGAADPEAYVLRTNLDRSDTLDEVDLDYLTQLSDDGRLAAAHYDWSRFDGGMPSEISRWICENEGEEGWGPGLLGWNLAHKEVTQLRC